MDSNASFNSHYVPLTPPYPILYYRGRLGIQTGTLLVVNSTSQYGNMSGALKIVSMPVVSYVNKSIKLPQQLTISEYWAENKVWQVDISSTELLGYLNQSTINIIYFITVERLRNMSGMSSGFSICKLVYDIESLGLNVDTNFYPQNPQGSLELMYGHLDANTACLTSNNINNLLGLFVAVKEGSHEMMLKDISEQIDDYIKAVKRKDITIEFRCKEPQFAELINALNLKYAHHQ